MSWCRHRPSRRSALTRWFSRAHRSDSKSVSSGSAGAMAWWRRSSSGCFPVTGSPAATPFCSKPRHRAARPNTPIRTEDREHDRTDPHLFRPTTLSRGAAGRRRRGIRRPRSEEHTSELQSLMRISYAVFCLKKKKRITQKTTSTKNFLYIQQSPKGYATTQSKLHPSHHIPRLTLLTCTTAYTQISTTK